MEDADTSAARSVKRRPAIVGEYAVEEGGAGDGEREDDLWELRCGKFGEVGWW